jgi:phosphomannomutase
MASTSSPSIYLQGNARKSSFPSSATNKPFHTTLSFSFSLPSSSTKVIRVNSSSSTAKYNKVLVDEEIDNIRRLQNGSDVRGVALEGEKGRTVDLSPPAVEAIAESFGEWVIDGLEKERGVGGAVEDVRVSFGRDPRISGPSLSVAVFDGLSRAGCCVFDMGLATTPACFMSTLLPPFACHASIMVPLVTSLHSLVNPKFML